MGARFQLMTANKKCFADSEEIEALIAEHEERLERLSRPNTEGKINQWTVRAQGELLADYYNALNQKAEVKRVLSMEEKAFMHNAERMSAMQLLGNLDDVFQLYSHYGLE